MVEVEQDQHASPPTSVADVVHQDLRGRILSGDLAPGQALPSERKLSESFGINRGAVREALQRLAQARLITVHHGGATRVLDYRDAGLDLLADLLARPGRVDPELVRSMLEMRNALGPLIARFAARRGGTVLADALHTEVEAFAQTRDVIDRYAHVRQIWRLLAVGSGNLALRLALNSLQQGTAKHEAMARMVLADELTDPTAYRALVVAVRVGDEAAAADATAAIIAPTMRRAEALLGR